MSTPVWMWKREGPGLTAVGGTVSPNSGALRGPRVTCPRAPHAVHITTSDISVMKFRGVSYTCIDNLNGPHHRSLPACLSL